MIVTHGINFSHLCAKERNYMTDPIIQSIGNMLIGQQQTIAVAESVTSGHIQSALSTCADAAKFFQGGITAYNSGQKSRHLHVEPIHASICNSVSERVAHEMALGVCKLFMSDWGLAITGYASKVPESNNELFAFYAIVYADMVMLSGKIEPPDGEPAEIQSLYSKLLLGQLENMLKRN
jgi:nicotinamide-nucleotide amidase